MHMGCAGLNMAGHQLPASGLWSACPSGGAATCQWPALIWDQLKLTSGALRRSQSTGPVWARAHSPAAAGTAVSTPQQPHLPEAQQAGLLSVSHRNRRMALQLVSGHDTAVDGP